MQIAETRRCARSLIIEYCNEKNKTKLKKNIYIYDSEPILITFYYTISTTTQPQRLRCSYIWSTSSTNGLPRVRAHKHTVSCTCERSVVSCGGSGEPARPRTRLRSPLRGVSSSAICEARSPSARVRCSGVPRQSNEDGDTGNDGGGGGHITANVRFRRAQVGWIKVRWPFTTLIYACGGGVHNIPIMISTISVVTHTSYVTLGQSNRTLATFHVFLIIFSNDQIFDKSFNIWVKTSEDGLTQCVG